MKKDPQTYQVLIVEDNPGDTLLISDYLEDEIVKPSLHEADSFESAKAFIECQEAVDVILLDLTLPDMEGQALLTEMLSIAGGVPIIVLTGYTDLAFAKKSLALGASDYLLKDALNSTILYKSIIYSMERNGYLLQIKESQRRYSDLFQLSPQPMWVFDLDTLRFLDVNEAAVRHYGYSKAEFLEMTIKDIRPGSEISHLEEALQGSKTRDSYFFQGEFIHRRKDGQVIIVDVRSNIIHIEGRKAEIVLANDVTEKHKIQEELHTNTYLVQTRERKRISTAIHDGLQQTLLAAYMRFESIRTKPDVFSDNTIGDRYEDAVVFLKEGIEQARSMAHELVPIQVEVEGLADAINSLVLRYRSDEINIYFEENLQGDRLHINLEVLLFRLVQEGFNNIIKHAEATQVRVKLEKKESVIWLNIQDNGKGFDVDHLPKSSFGLNSMRSRVKDAAGDLQITSQKNKGTQLQVRLPLR